MERRGGMQVTRAKHSMRPFCSLKRVVGSRLLQASACWRRETEAVTPGGDKEEVMVGEGSEHDAQATGAAAYLPYLF